MSELANNQARFTLTIDGAPGSFNVLRWQCAEGISSLYQARVEALADEPSAPHDLLGKSALLTVHSAEGLRHIHGIVATASEGRQGLRQRLVEVVIAPRAWRLTHHVDTRIFQQKGLRDILTEVLKAHGIDGDQARFELQNPHDPHDYCVQYRESDWAFVSRLCEEEGVFCFFEHTESGHAMVFADHPRVHAAVEGDASVALHDETAQVESHAFIAHLWTTARIGVGSVRLQDYNFVQPTLDLGSDAAGERHVELELYDHPGGHESLAVGRRVAKLRLEEQVWQHHTAFGRSNCARLVPGRRFTLDDVDGVLREELRQEYVVLTVTHRGEQQAAQGDGGAARAPEYTNEFEVIPASVPYRPPCVTPRPIVHGVQTAIVVGPAGEEIYTDSHGRVKVQFHWDRLGGRDEHSSCWMRVSQAWAGQGYGFIAIPRIGHEVIVSFLEGDPDRPLVTGRVYHGTNTVPYELPGDMTRTTLKSNSSPGGGGSNELRFEDAAGSEEIYLHGQKDWNIAIENDKGQTVGRDESLNVGRDRAKEVGNDQSERVGHDKTISVGNDHTEEIGANSTITIGAHHVESVGASRQEEIAENVTLDVGGDSTTEVRGNLSLTVLQAKTEEVNGASSEAVGGAKSVEVGGAYSVTVTGAMSVTAEKSITEHTAVDLSVSADGKVTVHSAKDTSLGADKKMALLAKDNLSITTEKKMALTATDQVTVTCGDATVTLKKNGDIVVKGKKITVEGSGDVVIKGSKVAVN